MNPIIIGVSTIPEFVALSPSTPWTKRGRYRIAPNIAALTRNVAITETTKMLFLNSRGLMIGSAARISIKTKMISMTTENAKRPMICQEPQGYCVPAHEKASSKGTVPATRVTEPR